MSITFYPRIIPFQGHRIFLCGTKLDLVKEGAQRVIDPSVVNDYANEVGVKVYETSSKTGEGVEQLFTDICLEVLNDE